jgi:glycosyltransferase involved in cell wall biosynthesis
MNNLILLVPHYNNLMGLIASLASINSEEKLDVIVVDDGSDKEFDEIKVRRSFLADGSVSFIYLKRNSGIEIALNTGLKYIADKKYTYIARLDCGDFCVRNRFRDQKLFLEKNDKISLVGSNVKFFDTNGVYLYTVKVPENDKLIRKKMFINAMHIHPAIMFRASILETIGFYPVKFKAAEDYAFFFNVINSFQVANIDRVLVHCEVNPRGISTLLRNQQAKNRIKIILKNFYFGLYPVYGLLRSFILYLLPLNFLIKIKKITKN